MATALVLERGPRLFLVAAPSSPREFSSLEALRRALSSDDPGGRVSVESHGLVDRLASAIAPTLGVATLEELRAARSALPVWDPVAERSFLLAAARDALAKSLRSPEEVLITLAREEERLERTVGREVRAAESFIEFDGSPFGGYTRDWRRVRETLQHHHKSLSELVHRQARTVVPNLSAVVGDRTAARLVAAAGGVDALARMRAGRIQLLGSRRRPSPDRGPRYGLLFRADGMDELPLGRRGAYARSLAAIAAIAARADATTRTSIWPDLVVRRDRRRAQLRSRR